MPETPEVITITDYLGRCISSLGQTHDALIVLLEHLDSLENTDTEEI